MIDTEEGWDRKVAIFKGQCFNNATVLLQDHEKTIQLDAIFKLAQKLFDDGMERGWIKRKVDTRKLDEAGKVKETLNQEQGRAMDPKVEEEVVI